MKYAHRIAAATAVVAAVLVGACSDAAPTEPLATGSQLEDLFRTPAAASAAPRTIDAEFERIARDVPGFGGFFYDEAGELNVYMAGPPAVASAQAANVLSGRARHLGLTDGGRPLRVRQGSYDFRQLSTFRRTAAPVFGLEGVVFTDVDEARNRVTIGVENEAAAAAVGRTLSMLDAPREAFVVTITEPIKPLQSLRDQVRPVAGGLQLLWPDLDGGWWYCTLGFNVRAPDRPNVEGFVTNSHCTASRGATTGTQYWQPSTAIAGSLIGTEAYDAPFFGCVYQGYLCRYSDAAGVRYTSDVEQAFGYIYRTTGPGSLEIDAANPRWRIVEELPYPVAGQTLHKTGRTTGWTSGVVTQTCVDTGVSGSNPPIAMLCQDYVQANSAGGDSGSPVFERIGDTNDVRLVGILWGGGGGSFVLSSMENIRIENEGPFGWITYPGQTPPAQ